eukprot:3634168-Amphidinium_carterae.2
MNTTMYDRLGYGNDGPPQASTHWYMMTAARSLNFRPPRIRKSSLRRRMIMHPTHGMALNDMAGNESASMTSSVNGRSWVDVVASRSLSAHSHCGSSVSVVNNQNSEIQTVVRMDQSVQSVLLIACMGVVPFSAVIALGVSQKSHNSEESEEEV